MAVVEGLKNFVHFGPKTLDVALDRSLTGLTNLQTIVAQCTTPAEQARLVPLLNDLNAKLYGVDTGELSRQSAQTLLENAQHITKQVEGTLKVTKMLSDDIIPHPDAPSLEVRQQTQRTSLLFNGFRDASESLTRGLAYIEKSLSALDKDINLNEVIGKNIAPTDLVKLGSSVGKGIMAFLPKAAAGVAPAIAMFNDLVNLQYFHDVALKKTEPLVAEGSLTSAAAEAYGVAFAKSTLMYQMGGQIDPTIGAEFIADWASEYHVKPEALNKLGHESFADQKRSQSFAPEI